MGSTPIAPRWIVLMILLIVIFLLIVMIVLGFGSWGSPDKLGKTFDSVIIKVR